MNAINQDTELIDIFMITDLQKKLMNLVIMIDIVIMEKNREKRLKEELNCVFVRINPDKKDFNIFKAINKIHRHMFKSTKKFVIDDTKRLLKPHNI